jgi:hypothetical protein
MRAEAEKIRAGAQRTGPAVVPDYPAILFLGVLACSGGSITS